MGFLETLGVVLAAFASFALGAAWYGAMARPWMAAAGIKQGPDGQPEGGLNPVTYVLAFGLQLLVAGMMRHVFSVAGVGGLFEGLVSGAGIGLFFITPWIALNNMYGQRPLRLTLIDGAYAIAGCAAMGTVLALFV